MSTGGKVFRSKDPAIQYAASNSLRLHPAQSELIEKTTQLKNGGMLGSADELQLLQNLVRSIGAKKTIDVGVFTGYSTLSIALALPHDGKVVACDITDEYLEIGGPVWKKAGVEHKIDFMKGPADESLLKLLQRGEAGSYDFAFIDADKVRYDKYYELCLALLRSGGIIALDNMLWGGSVYNEQASSPDIIALRELAKKIHEDTRVNVSFLTVGDGTVLAFKK